MNGFIKIDRGMLDWGWYDDPSTKIVFLHLLLTANWKEREYRGHKLKVGDTVFGVSALADRLGLSVRQVRTAIQHLEKTGEITVKATNKFSIATLENWAKYQFEEEEATNNRQTKDNQSTTPKERKNIKKYVPPTLEEVKEYAYEKQSPVDYEYFWNYYNLSNWDGVKNWKQKFLTWDKKERERQPKAVQERPKYTF